MTDLVIVDGDQAVFQPAFGPATVVVQPGKIAGTGKATVTGKAACVEGDEASVSVAGCAYTMGAFVGGIGTITIQRLAPDQLAAKTATGGKKPIVKGAQFIAEFAVTKPAEQPSPGGPIPDPAPTYVGQGSFVSANTSVTAG